MTDQYARAKATALRLIAKQGVAVTWQAEADPAPGGDPWNPQPGTALDPQTVNVVFFPVGLQMQRTLQAVTGAEVPESYEYGLLPGDVGFTPRLSDIVTRNGVVLPIVKIDTLAPAGEAVLHTVYFRR